MPDKYTQKSLDWLNQRFEQTDSNGVYFAHQPVYGFRAGHSEMGLTVRYIRTYQILKALAHLKFSSLLDVGGAEGYKSYVAQQFFKTKVVSSDLSQQANQRAKELFNIPTKQADIHQLPFTDEEFDVVLCSETLEHVTDYQQAVSELIRVAKKAVIITVPFEKETKSEFKFGHIHTFTKKSLDYLQEQHQIIHQKMISPILYGLAFVLEAQKISTLEEIPSDLHQFLPYEYQENIKKIKPFLRVYNRSLPLLEKLAKPKLFAQLLKLDNLVCSFTPWYKAHLFTIVKQSEAYLNKPKKEINPQKLINIKVPLHYLT